MYFIESFRFADAKQYFPAYQPGSAFKYYSTPSDYCLKASDATLNMK